MSNMSYLSVLERYKEQRGAIDQLLCSILTGLSDHKLLDNEEELVKTMRWLADAYPFVDLIFTLDVNGFQTSKSIDAQKSSSKNKDDVGRNRCQRPYFSLVQSSDDAAVVTEPYLSSANHLLCVSAAEKVFDDNGALAGYMVIDIDLAEAVEFLMGDRARRRYQPFFKLVYGIIVLGLFSVVLVLLYTVARETVSLFTDEVVDAAIKPFSIIIYLTLALAVFDLGKTMLEEEVLMHKDIFRHSSTRRTITRFIAAILIAVSIESLLLMFKSVLGDGTYLVQSVLMMLAAVGLLVGLGIYVYLGSKAEQNLLLSSSDRRRGQRRAAV